MKKLTSWIPAALLALSFGACSSGSPSEAGAEPSSPDAAAGSAEPDTATGPIDPPGPEPDGGAKPEGDAAASDEPSCDEAPYDFRCSCYDNTDCASGWCIEDVVGHVCTETCLENCPDGWSCRSVQNVGEDVVYLCVPDLVDLCRPCEADSDCGGADDLCVPVGGESRCAAGCAVDADCPAGYSCQDVVERDATKRQCLPATGSCVCNAELNGTTTACTVKNEHGTCYGETTCAGADGWTACSAPEPSEEVCDGIDNDCDGAFDEDTAGCVVLFPDADGDGYGRNDGAECLCAPKGTLTATVPGDCDDEDPARHPGLDDVCNGIDDDCSGLADEGCDQDGDGYCASAVEGDAEACPSGGGDCDDLDASVNPGKLETCNGKDDDCDGLEDEEGGAPCGGCAQVCQLEVGSGTDTPFSPSGASGTGVTPDGSLTLDASSFSLHMLWVANSGENTVSKIDTDTGKEVARYAVCGDPSRTAVDPSGDCWVGCRADGKIAKIALDLSSCVDADGDGVLETSVDANGDGKIAPSEMLPAGKDECVLLTVQPESDVKARALAIDAEGHPWVGYYETRSLHRLDPATGKTVATVDLSGVSSGKPYGMAIDQLGRIWVALRDGNPTALAVVDPTVFPIEPKAWGTPDGHQAYGIAVDPKGRVWLAGGESRVLSRFDPVKKTWKTLSLSGKPHARGVAVAADGLVYVAHHDFTSDCAGGKDHYVTVVDSDSVSIVDTIDTSTGDPKLGPVGLAIDFDDHLWAIDQCSSTATKIDRKTHDVIAHYPTGTSPYTYSDMTGFALKTVVAPEGTYKHVFTGWNGVKTQWLQIQASGLLPDGTAMWLRWRTAEDTSDLSTVPWSATEGPFPPSTMPVNLEKKGEIVGKYLQVEVTLQSGAGAVPVLKSLTAVATPL